MSLLCRVLAELELFTNTDDGDNTGFVDGVGMIFVWYDECINWSMLVENGTVCVGDRTTDDCGV